MKILSVANEKGGVGKTVLAANLAWELSRKNYCVLVVDLDQQCDLTKLLYREADPPQHDIVELLKGQCSLVEACTKVKENLHIIPGNKNLKFYKRKGETRLFGDVLLPTYVSNNTAVPNSIQQGKTLRELVWSTPALSQIKKVSAELEERLGLPHGNGQTLGEQA